MIWCCQKFYFPQIFLFSLFSPYIFFLSPNPLIISPPPPGGEKNTGLQVAQTNELMYFHWEGPQIFFLATNISSDQFRCLVFMLIYKNKKHFCKSVQSFRRYDQKRCVCRTRNGDNINAVLLGFGGKTRFNLRPGKLRFSQNEVKIMDRGQSSCAKGS